MSHQTLGLGIVENQAGSRLICLFVKLSVVGIHQIFPAQQESRSYAHCCVAYPYGNACTSICWIMNMMIDRSSGAMKDASGKKNCDRRWLTNFANRWFRSL